MKKRLLSLFLLLLIVLTACAQKTGQPQASTSGTTLQTQVPETTEPGQDVQDETALPFWTATDIATGAKIFLLGSIHAARNDLYPLPQEIMDAYKASDYVAVETDIVSAEQDMALLVRCMEKMVYTDGTKITNHISAELYQQAKDFLTREGLYNITLDYMMPVMWATTIQNIWITKSTLESELGVDRYFINLALADKKSVVEIESAEEQYEMLASFSPKLQEMFLASALENPEQQVKDLEELYDVWLTGDLDRIEQMTIESEEELTDEERETLEEYNTKLVYNRNPLMGQRAAAFLKEQKTCFFIVGAAHMAGETGVLAYLTQQGYQVEKGYHPAK